MTQEEKAKAYDEAIERARYWAKCPTVWNSDDICQKIFPELVESEENRIKRCIGMALTDVSEKRFTDYDTSLRDCLDWLEKQSKENMIKALQLEYEKGKADALQEQRKDWSEEDERIHQCLIRDQEKALDDVRNDKYGHSEIISDLKEMYRERINWLESIKQRIGE